MDLKEIQGMQAEKDFMMRNEGPASDYSDLDGYVSYPDSDQVAPYPY